jgi:hypothetical protein
MWRWTLGWRSGNIAPFSYSFALKKRGKLENSNVQESRKNSDYARIA